jgi:hypothetical protein
VVVLASNQDGMSRAVIPFTVRPRAPRFTFREVPSTLKSARVAPVDRAWLSGGGGGQLVPPFPPPVDEDSVYIAAPLEMSEGDPVLAQVVLEPDSGPVDKFDVTADEMPEVCALARACVCVCFFP